MEILQQFKQNGYFTVDLYHLLAAKKMVDSKEEIIPSQYEKEMKLGTQERLRALDKIEVDNIVTTGRKPDKIVLSITPRVIMFQNFKPNDKLVAKFSVKNISKGPTYLNMIYKESSYFFVKPCGGQLLSRLAPGISVTFAVTFAPEQFEDYTHRVTFYTDKDQYVLPLIAMGPRPVFDFPDEIVFPKVPLKVESKVSVVITNIGIIAAGFKFSTKCPFTIQPKSVYLNPREKVEVKVTFKTMHLGSTESALYALCETGENFKIKLSGSTHSVSIELEKEVVRFQDTYNTMVRQQTFKITNKSEHTLTYMCLKNSHIYHDFEEKVHLATIFYNLKKSESAKCQKLVQYDVMSSNEHDRVYTRIFYDEVHELVADESLHFQDTHFAITPIKGQLWPKKPTELVITFNPKAIGEFKAVAYLDIDGVPDRVPLTMVGASLPPYIHLNLETLNMDCVYINKVYNYEIVAINKGHINGVILYKVVPTLFGSHITCTPELHCLRPGEKEVFVISFSNSNQGPYFEEINFVISDSDVLLKLYLKGEVIYPSLMFSIPCLDFGMVSVGVPKTLEVEVINESIVTVNGTVNISSDGPEVSSIRLGDYAVSDVPKPEIPKWPREFDIEPCKIEITPESRVSIKITLTANLIRANQTSLELELEKSDSPPIILPVTFDARIPEITPAANIKLRACFLDFAYHHDIQVSSNEFQGYFTVEDQDEGETLQVTVGVKEGIVEPNSTITFPVSIMTRVLGVQEHSIRLNMFGLSKSIEICHITGCGVRPIVTCTPLAMHWGQVKLLTKSRKSLTLCNDSPVYVYFKASLLNRDGRWNIQPNEGYVEPEGETDLILTLYLIDADTYTNKAVIQLEKVKDILVPLSATGVGTSILVGQLRDRVILGRHFTRIPLNSTVMLENCGTRMHALEWTEHYKLPKTKPLTAGFFNLEPRLFKMAAGEKMAMTITAVSHKVTTIKEIWYLVGSVEGINKKELLLECQIVAEFVEPKIEVSSTVIDFRYDYGPYSEFYKLTDIVTIKNVSKLTLDMEISVKPPFAIIQKQTTYKITPEEEKMCCCINYRESDLNLQNIRNESGVYLSKVFIDYLTLKPVEPLRKSPLNFFQDISKIKMAFNLTHAVEERLEDQEVMKLQILFDTTKHLTLKSRVYCELMRNKFKGHKNKDTIKLTGKINFPNMFVITPRVDFQCILNESIESKTVKIQNITPLHVCYKFQWKKGFITTVTLNFTKQPELPSLKYANDESVLESSTFESEPELNVSGSPLHEILGSRSPTHSPLVKTEGNEVTTKEFPITMRTELEPGSIVPDPLRPEVVDFEIARIKTMQNVTPMIKADYDPKFPWIHKFPRLLKQTKSICINEVLQLTPHRGILKPNESQYIHVIFTPKPNISIRAVLECEILGGPPEYVVVTGQSSKLMYTINTHKLNFKIRSFHEHASERLCLSNIAQLVFEYKTYLDEPKFENELEGTILDLVPESKILEPEEEAQIQIIMRPGVVGYFHRVFLLEIGHLPHIPIEVFGWGVVPQIYISLQRPEIKNLDPEFGYCAISTLTQEYMQAISEIFMKRTSEHLNSPQTGKCFEDPDLQLDWHICTAWDGYPSVMDIELAIERMLVIEYLKLRPEIFTAYSTSSKIGPIPGFLTTPYVIDFGVVITGSTVQCVAEIINYGPIATKLHFAKGTQIPTWLGIKLCGKLNAGESGMIEVTFAPTSFTFMELEQDVEASFNLEVPYGITIPIKIEALCAVPYLTSNISTIDFGSVRCGNKIICSIPLKNVGKPTCIWYVTLRLKAPGNNPMMVLNSSGKYEPGEGGWLSIAFKPTTEMTYEGLLIFRFHMNPNRLTMPVIGYGIMPRVHIIGPNVSFSPTLPWAETTDIYFGLTNPCPFPLELIFAHSDEKWTEEEDIYNLLYKYYNKPEEMLVPAIKPGAGMPSEIIMFYKTFTERVKKTVEEEAAAAKAALARASEKKPKPPKNLPKVAPKKGADKDELVPVRRFRNEAEIISDEMKNLKEINTDPLKECLESIENASRESETNLHTKGLIVFVHGSPCEEMQCQEMAYTIGKSLSLPTVNIDLCVVEALCSSVCPAKIIIASAVNEMFQLYRRNANKEDDVDDECCDDDLFGETGDEFEVTWKKIIFLANSKNVATPRSKASEKKKKKSPTSSMGSHTALGAMGPVTMFHMDLIQELLTDYFAHPKFQRGFVVDTLTSIVLKSPPLALTTVLKCKRSILNVHLVLCQSDFTKWVQTFEEIQRDNDLLSETVNKIYNDTEIDLIVQNFEDMDDEEFENAPQELRNIYVVHGLDGRRRKYFDSLGLVSEGMLRKDKSTRGTGTDRSKSLLLVNNSESKKKIKKEEARGKPTNEYVLMSTKYNEYNKTTYENLINIANNWVFEEAEVGSPMYGFTGQLIGSTQKKAKKKSEIQLQMSDTSFKERGFPLTLVMCPCLNYKDALVDMFTKSPLVQEVLKEEAEFDILNCPMKRKEFTVLLPKTMPHIHHEKPLDWCFLDEMPIKKCECNQLTDLNLLEDTTQDNILNIFSKWHCTCGKKLASSQTSTSDIGKSPSASLEKVTVEDSVTQLLHPCPLPLRSVKSIPAPGSRLVLQPGDLVRCKYSFSPQWEGHFSVKRFVEVSGWPESRVDINVNGICDLPRIDRRPKKIFGNFVRRTVEDNVYKITYLDDLKVFEFGPIFIGPNRIYEEEYTINLKNASLIKANVEIECRDNTTIFELGTNIIMLDPGCRGKLKITAAPAEVGVHGVVLLFCVKDNPEIVTVNIACSGIEPVIQILPLTKHIEYGKLLLYRRGDDRFIVKNDSILPIMWKVRNAEDFVEDFIIAQTSGIVPRHENQVVPVTYIACRVGVISNKTLIMDIYDAEGRGNPMVIDQLFLSAECYDVQVECAFENPGKNFLNYGNVKVNSTVSSDMFLLNKGKYNIYFRLKKVKNFPEPSLLKGFQARPECGLVPCALKLVNIEFECTPTTSMNLVNVPAYICSLLDGSKDQVVVAKFPVCVTIASFYNTFTLFPLGELNFNIIAVGSGVIREVILNNTSKCPVTYEIVLPPEYRPDPDAPAAPAKLKDNKIKVPPLKCGNFLILNEDNLLAPGSSRTIQIQFLATAARKFEETINFVISDTCPAEANGVPLRLVGIGAIPTLDFWNIETTFREHLILKNLSEYKVSESAPHCVFVEDSVTLHFFCVTVDSKLSGALDMYNNGFVPCALTMKLHYQGNSNEGIFSLDRYETHIESLQHKSLGIIFTPKALTEYRAVLEVQLKLLDNQQQSFKICLIGEGVIPRIHMIWPAVKQHKISLLRMPVTCLGSVSTQAIRFKNISSVKSIVKLNTVQSPYEERHVFWITAAEECNKMVIRGHKDESNIMLQLQLKPAETARVIVHYNPVRKGKTSCEIRLRIVNNPYEYFTVFCEAEAFMEDVILIGLEMLSMDADLDAIQISIDGGSSASTVDSKKKPKSANIDVKKAKLQSDPKKNKRASISSMKQSESGSNEPSFLKYILDFGGCELCFMQKRSVVMLNNSEKVYKFIWEEVEHVVVKPSIGYISPGEEKDFEIIFFSTQPIIVRKELLSCTLTSISDDTLTLDIKGTTWDNRQTITTFDHNKKTYLNERIDEVLEEQAIETTGEFQSIIKMMLLYSALTEYTKYTCTLKENKELKDTFIYTTRKFDFTVKNTGRVPMKIVWTFHVDEEFPARINRHGNALNTENQVATDEDSYSERQIPDRPVHEAKDESKVTLFSGSLGRKSADTWFEVDLPFQIEPSKDCLGPNETRVFKVTFSPQDAFDYRVRLKSWIDNLDPYDQNVACRIKVKSLIPYCHLDIEESDYITSGRRKTLGVVLPPFTTVLEFNVLGCGCYKKSFNVINPTSGGYEFIFEMVISDKPELIPMHCNMLKGYVEGGTSTEVTFTFAPTAPGTYESQWNFVIPVHNLVNHLLVVGLVREPDVVFVPTILLIRNSLVGFTVTDTVMLKNNETECLKFEFKGNSLCNDSGKTPVIMEPEFGTLKPRSETPIKFIYTPIDDGPLSFKIFCSITYMTKYLKLCVNALSNSIKPKVAYYLIGNVHLLNSEAITNIHLDQTASTYERTLTFVIQNEGSATFFFDWNYNCASVKKYLQVFVEPRSGHVSPGCELECTLHFLLKQVPVQAFPVSLKIPDGPLYNIFLHAEIEKPLYHFSCTNFDFGKCIVNAPDTTYNKNIAFHNDDKEPLILDLDFEPITEILIDYVQETSIAPNRRSKIAVYFRPKQVKEYEFKLRFWVNSLCEETITVKGEGVPLLVDLYEGCQKSFDMGPVKVGDKVVRQIEVMNYSKVPINATFIFKEMYPTIDDELRSETTSVCLSPSAVNLAADSGPTRVQMLQNYKDDKVRKQIAIDIENALSSLKVIPNKCTIKPFRKVPLKIQMKPVGLISTLSVQLNMQVLNYERPLVKLSGSATGMSLSLSQSSLQFGRVRIRGCKILKVMLLNKGDFGARFWWQPLISDEFTISPMYGNIAAHTNVTFTITFRPINHNPFIKVWASCIIENYTSLELAMYATCVDIGNVQAKSIYLECPVREVKTEYVSITNPSDEMWLILSEMPSGPGPFSTLKEFHVEPNSVFNVPINFKPKTMGKHEGQIFYSPLGESALFISLVGAAGHPNPNGTISITVAAKTVHTENLLVRHIAELPESYVVSTEIEKIYPDKFDGYYEIQYPDTVKVWGETAATCRWNFVCYDMCEMHMRVVFLDEASREYQFYNIVAAVSTSQIVDVLTFESRARETVRKEVVVSNPLGVDADFYVKCLSLSGASIIRIGRQSESTLALSYSPLVVGESEEEMEISNQLAGTYVYKVILKCLPAKTKDLEVATPLGTSVPMRVRVQNRTDVRANFTSNVTHPSILTVEKEYSLGPFEKGKFLVMFEPTDLGVQRCQLSFNCQTAGEFTFNIKGKGTEPKPQGPYEIKAGGCTTITFKNVFMDTVLFKMTVDRQEFYIKTLYEPIRSKKDIKLQVYLNELAGPAGAPPTGCLTVECYDPAEPRVQWTYFLQGIR